MSSVTAGAGPGAEQDRPTLVMDVPSPLSSPPGRAGAVPGPVRWPEPSGVNGGVSAPVHLPSDISGRTSGGGQLPSHPGGHPVTRAPEYRTDHAYEHPGLSPAAEADRAAGRGALDAEGYPLPAPAGASSASSAPSEQSAPSGAGGPAGSSGDTAATAPASADPRAAAPPTGAPVRRCVFCGVGPVSRDAYCETCGKAQPRERDHMETALDAVAAVSDRGLRHHRNEDAYAVAAAALPDGSPAVVAIVCDGVSSASRPDEASLAASRAASECALDLLPRGVHPQQAMHRAIVAASEAVNALAEEDPTAGDGGSAHQNAPACTVVGAIVVGELLVIGWVGDSRAYWVPADRAAPSARLTEDDSWAAQMVAAGLMSEAEAYADERAHAITGWLGADAYELEPHTVSFKPDRAGVVVVCTDGLWNYAESAQDMAAVLAPDAGRQPLAAARALVSHALEGGGHDNVTVALVPFPAPGQGAGSA